MFDVTVIKPEDQRYPTAADWFTGPDGVRHFRISDMGEQSTRLVAIHEQIEELLCNAAGVTQEQVDEWDNAHLDAEDPGLLPGCPYQEWHMIALAIEHMLAAEIGLDWGEHDDAVNAAFDVAEAACAAREK